MCGMRSPLLVLVLLLVACSATDPAAPAGDDAAELARASVASVSISPATATLHTGATAAFSAVVLDTRSRTVSNAQVTWFTTDPSVATVTSRGLLTAVAAGTTSVIAEAGGLRDTSSVLVEAATAPPSGGNASCAAPRPEWIWCDDFETDRLASYFEYVSANGSFSRAAGVGRGGSQGMRARFAVGQVSAGNLKLAFGRTPSDHFRPVDAGTRDYRDIYWRLYLRTQDGWTGGGGHKLTRATVFAGSNWSQAAIAHLWTSGVTLTIDPASGTTAEGQVVTTTYNDFANLRWLGWVTGTTPLFDDSHVGRWYCIETRMRLNDAGQANGIEEFWIDGRLEARRADLNFLGAYDDYGINTVMFENYWNGGSPAAQERYFDDIVVSTAPIGC
jgi:hypothetical protein